MKFYQTYHPFIAFFLAALLLNAIILKEAHNFMGHDHEEGIECEATGGETHFHDSIANLGDCFICNLLLSPAEKSPQFVKNSPLLLSNLYQTWLINDPIVDKSYFLPGLRAPPVSV